MHRRHKTSHARLHLYRTLQRWLLVTTRWHCTWSSAEGRPGWWSASSETNPEHSTATEHTFTQTNTSLTLYCTSATMTISMKTERQLLMYQQVSLVISTSKSRNRRYNIDTTAKQAAMVWACAAKRRHWLGEEMYGIWGGGLQTKR